MRPFALEEIMSPRFYTTPRCQRTSQEIVGTIADLSPKRDGLLVQVLRALQQPDNQAVLLGFKVFCGHSRQYVTELFEESLDSLLQEPWRASTLDLDIESYGAGRNLRRG